MDKGFFRQDHGKPVFFGFLAIGFLSLVGGIAMFIYVVPRDMDTGGAPRDVGMIFTGVYTKQMLLFNERHRYAAALSEVDVDRDTCDRYNCRLTVPPEGNDYVFRLGKNGRVWAMTSKTPVPKEEK